MAPGFASESDAFAHFFAVFCAIVLECAIIECVTDFLHEVVVEPQIVHNEQSLGQHFTALEQVAQIGAAEPLTGRTLTAFFDRTVIGLVLSVHNVQNAVVREQMTVTRVACRHNAVEEINAASDTFNNVARRADTHQVARLMLGRMRQNNIENMVHDLGAFTDGKTAEEVLTQQIEQGTAELDYLESVLAALSEAENERDLAQLREELTQSGVLSAKQTRNKKLRGKPAQAKPFHYRTSDGFDVFAGKNNLQNDLLTLKTAFKSDIWFHTQKIHGSHVILVTDGREPTDEAMTEAAMIAAYHSRGRSSSLVPVDYTPVRQVKKPAGAKPGMVIYHVYQTAYVTPNEAEVEKLRVE